MAKKKRLLVTKKEVLYAEFEKHDWMNALMSVIGLNILGLCLSFLATENIKEQYMVLLFFNLISTFGVIFVLSCQKFMSRIVIYEEVD